MKAVRSGAYINMNKKTFWVKTFLKETIKIFKKTYFRENKKNIYLYILFLIINI